MELQITKKRKEKLRWERKNENQLKKVEGENENLEWQKNDKGEFFNVNERKKLWEIKSNRNNEKWTVILKNEGCRMEIRK